MTHAAAPASLGATPGGPDQRRAQHGWALYDVANSAFVTTMVAALAGPYLLGLAGRAADASGRVHVGPLALLPGAFVAYLTAASVVVQVLLLPLFGAVIDVVGAKRAALGAAAALGSLLTLVMGLLPQGAWLGAGLAYAAANVAFGASIVPYNAMLADVSSAQERDRVSARGFAYGYAGGGVLLAANLALLQAHGALGLSSTSAARLDIASVAVWWAVFTLVALRTMGRPAQPAEPRRTVPWTSAVRSGLGELDGALRDLRRYPDAARYLGSFLLWNDAVQGVIGLAGVFVLHELFVAHGQSASSGTPFVLLLVLVIQAAAVPGSLLFARAAHRFGTKRTIVAGIACWVLVVLYAWLFLQTRAQAVGLAVAIALVLGGSQSLARSLFTRMIPPGRDNAWMGLYETSERGTAWISPLVFGLALSATGSYRLGLASLLTLFVAGGLLLAATDTDRAVAAAELADR